MTEADRKELDALPLPLILQLDEACGRFETAWQSAAAGGTAPRIEDYVAAPLELGQSVLIRELVRIDIKNLDAPRNFCRETLLAT